MYLNISISFICKSMPFIEFLFPNSFFSEVDHREKEKLKSKGFFKQYFEMQFISLSYVEIH